MPTIKFIEILNGKLQELRSAIPRSLWIYGQLYLLALVWICFWVPINDWDSLSAYLVRIKLEEFGPLRQTATQELEYLFPKFYDYLFGPFLRLGYFASFPSLALTLAMLVLFLKELQTRSLVIALALVLACQPILIQATSGKNDLGLAVLGLIAWFVIARMPNSKWYLAATILALCALVGTKWHGVLLAGGLGAVLLWRLATDRRPAMSGWFVAGLFLPFYYIVSSANTYIENFKYDGGFFPAPAYLGGRIPWTDLPANIGKFIVTSFLDTFDIGWYLLDIALRGKVWKFITQITFEGKAVKFAVAATSDIAYFGVVILIVLLGCVVCLFQRRREWSVRASAAVALYYWVAMLAPISYSSWTNRYFLPVYILGIIPTALVAADLRWPRWSRITMAIYAVVISLMTLTTGGEHVFKGYNYYIGHCDCRWYIHSMFSKGFDRDRLSFLIWWDHEPMYDFMKKNILFSDSLIFVNGSFGGDRPFLYPFIKDRQPANTRIVNHRYGQSVDPLMKDGYKFIMTFKAPLNDPRYAEVYQLRTPSDGGSEWRIYKLK